SWVTVAPANWVSSQTAMSFNAASGPSACGRRPSTTRPSPRLSAFVNACRRESESGKRSNPTVPARKKTVPDATATTVNASNRTCIASTVRRTALGRICDRSVVNERDDGESGQQGQYQRTIHGSRCIGAGGQQQQRRDAARAKQLRCHDAFSIPRPAQNADQS